jgi:hypothetical protein
MLVILFVRKFTNKCWKYTCCRCFKAEILSDFCYFFKEIILEQAKYPYKTTSLLASLLLLLGTLLLAGCQTAESDTVEEVALNAEPELVEMVTAVLSTEEPQSDPAADPVPVDNCLDCHSNKDLLIQTADPEEEVIRENEGEG